jgi:hypothetical protein
MGCPGGYEFGAKPYMVTWVAEMFWSARRSKVKNGTRAEYCSSSGTDCAIFAAEDPYNFSAPIHYLDQCT